MVSAKEKGRLPSCHHKNRTESPAPCRVSPMPWTCHKLTWSKVGMQTCRFIFSSQNPVCMVNQSIQKGHAEPTYWQCSSISFKHFTWMVWPQGRTETSFVDSNKYWHSWNRIRNRIALEQEQRLNNSWKHNRISWTLKKSRTPTSKQIGQSWCIAPSTHAWLFFSTIE